MSLRRTLLRPLVPVYAGVVSWRRRLFETGRLRSEALDAVVISVGSVSAGGAGKTPFTLLLADVLERRKFTVRILTRGYGRQGTGVERVDPSGTARRYGDESILLARRSNASVYVGSDRYRAGLAAQAEPSTRTVVYLLDDGFQHLRLRRDLDIVLLTRKDVEDALLPAGDLREPLTALGRADVLVVRQEEAASLEPLLPAHAAETGRPVVWQIRRRLDLTNAGGARIPKRPLVFCGIARPEGFLAMLEAEGCRPAASVVFRDHHAYGQRDIERLLERAKESGATGFVTTEKDAVKLTTTMCRQLERIGPLAVPELHVELLNEQAVLEQIISMVPRLDRRKSR